MHTKKLELSQIPAMIYKSNVDIGRNFPKHATLQHRFHPRPVGFVHPGARGPSQHGVYAVNDTIRAVQPLWGGCEKLQLAEVAEQGTGHGMSSGQGCYSGC